MTDTPDTTEEIQDYVLVALVRTPFCYMAHSALRAAMDRDYGFDINGLELWAAIDGLAKTGLVQVTGKMPYKRIHLNVDKLSKRSRPRPRTAPKVVA